MLAPALVRMPLGKFRGQQIEALPDYYIVWLVRKADLGEPYKSAIAAEYQRRGLNSRRAVSKQEIDAAISELNMLRAEGGFVQ